MLIYRLSIIFLIISSKMSKIVVKIPNKIYQMQFCKIMRQECACQEESCEGQEKEEDCEGGQDLYQCELLSNFKRTKSALGKISGLCRLTIEDYPCALVAGQPLRGRRQPATKVRRWNISQEPHGRISGSDLDPFSPHKREIKQPPRYQGLRNFH